MRANVAADSGLPLALQLLGLSLRFHDPALARQLEGSSSGGGGAGFGGGGGGGGGGGNLGGGGDMLVSPGTASRAVIMGPELYATAWLMTALARTGSSGKATPLA